MKHYVEWTRIAMGLAPILFWLTALSLHADSQRSGSVEVRFVDSATGATLQPDRFEVHPQRGSAIRRWTPDQLDRGRTQFELAPGRQTLSASSLRHRPMSVEIEPAPDRPTRVVFHLDPLETPKEIRPAHLATLQRVNETLFVGYVTAEDTGAPLAHARVRTEPSGRETVTDARGYFQIYVPVQTRAEALASPARLRFAHPGYRSVEHHYLELWSEGDWVYRIQLERGEGETVVDERQLRRRTDYPVSTREEVAAPEPEATPAFNAAPGESRGALAGGPITANAAAPPVLRIPTNIRVLRQDGVTIDYLSLQTYCQRSLPSEWIASWGSLGPGNSGTNCLNAGAVAIRTYAIGFINNPYNPNYDICGTTSCQAYHHLASDSRSTAAVNHTVNWVMNQPGATRIGFKLTEYSAENNSLGFSCGDGYTQPFGGCVDDPVCTGETRFGHGRGMCQWGTARWATGRRMQNRVTSDSVTNNFPLQDWVWLCEHYYPDLELVQGTLLMTNDYVQVQGTSSLTVRRCADGSISSGTGCPQLTTKASGATGLIVGGPVRITSDGVGYTWWQVQWFDAGATLGWSPENWLERIAQPPAVPPVLAPLGDLVVNEGATVAFTNSATAPAEAIALLTDFEGFADGTANGTVLFRAPNYSGSTTGFLDASPSLTSVTGSVPSGNDSARVLRANWSWNGSVSPWLRLTTGDAASLPNPIIAISRKLRFDIHTDRALKAGLGIRETTTATGTPLGSNGGTTGGIEYAGVSAGSGSPNPVRTVTAGSWTTLEFDLPSEPIRSFVGGNGVLSTASGLAVLEHLALVPAAGAGAYNIHLDNFLVAAPNTLTYSLSNAPAGATVNPLTGVFSWTPSESQGPGVYRITVIVTDNNLPTFSDRKTFQVTVNEVNEPPVLAALSDRTVHAGIRLTFTNAATDPDLPAQTLTFSLDPGATGGATVQPDSGVFSWQTAASDAGTTHPVTVRVTDAGTPPLSDAGTFNVVVQAPPALLGTPSGGGTLVLNWDTLLGTRYRVQFKDDLALSAWTDVVPDLDGTGLTLSYTNAISAGQRFFRVQVLP